MPMPSVPKSRKAIPVGISLPNDMLRQAKRRAREKQFPSLSLYLRQLIIDDFAKGRSDAAEAAR